MKINLKTLRWVLLAYALCDLLAGYAGVFPLTELAAAQFTTVTGTVTDPNGLPYANGTISAVLILPGGQSPTIGGLPYSPPTQPAGLDKNGSFTLQLGDNTQISPAATKWNFTVCSAGATVQPAIGTGSVCFSLAAPITISGASQDISTQLNAVALLLTLGSSSQKLVVTGGLTPASFANECASVLTGTGSALSPPAVPFIQVIDTTTSIVHDVVCRSAGAKLAFPLGATFAYSFGNSLSSGNKTFEIASSTAGRNGMTLTNTNSTSRGNNILWRSCNGGCGTDFNLFEDSQNNGNEDISWQQGTSITNLYFTGNCPVGCTLKFGPNNNATGHKQFLISDSGQEAMTNPELALIDGHISHGSGTASPDNWGTVTLAAGTGTYTFFTAWAAAPLCSCNNPNQTGAAIACSASATTTVLTLKSGAGTDTVNYECRGNPY